MSQSIGQECQDFSSVHLESRHKHADMHISLLTKDFAALIATFYIFGMCDAVGRGECCQISKEGTEWCAAPPQQSHMCRLQLCQTLFTAMSGEW